MNLLQVDVAIIGAGRAAYRSALEPTPSVVVIEEGLRSALCAWAQRRSSAASTADPAPDQ